MSHLSILNFKYNIARFRSTMAGRPAGRLLSARDRQPSSDLMMYKPEDEEMRKVFDKMSGGSGRISRRDLKALLETFGNPARVADDEARRMVCVADSKKDGHMDFEEFMEVHRSGVLLGDIRRAFFVFDRDGDGRISAEEVMAVLRKLGEDFSLEECWKMVKEIDRNHDGFVDMDDFMAMMTRPKKKP